MQRLSVTVSFWALIIFLLPQFSLAAGLVPCSGADCTVCDLGKLANNIINWLVNFSFMAATIMVVYGGYLIMTAGLSPKQHGEGLGIIYAAAIGLAIVLVSWVLINTVMQYLTNSKTWYTITCNTQTINNTNASPPLPTDSSGTSLQGFYDQQTATEVEALKFYNAQLEIKKIDLNSAKNNLINLTRDAERLPPQIEEAETEPNFTYAQQLKARLNAKNIKIGEETSNIQKLEDEIETLQQKINNLSAESF